jgi:hypothetical protein
MASPALWSAFARGRGDQRAKKLRGKTFEAKEFGAVLLWRLRGHLGVIVVMAGVILETLNNRKLLGIGLVALVLQVVAFLLGGLIGECCE